MTKNQIILFKHFQNNMELEYLKKLLIDIRDNILRIVFMKNE